MTMGRRREVRYDINLPLRLSSGGDAPFSAETVNLSAQGLYCRGRQFLQPYSKLEIDLQLPFKSREPVSLVSEGVVLRSDDAQGKDDCGLAVIFTNLDLEKACLLRDYIHETTGVSNSRDNSSALVGNVQNISGRVCPSRATLESLPRDQYLVPQDRLSSLEEWLSQLGHEINNPLAAISAALQALADEFPEEHPSSGIFQKILAQVTRLEGVADHLLQMACPERCHFEPIKIEAVLSRSLVLLQNKFQQKMINVQVRHGQRQPLLRGDQNLLQEALVQILSLALEGLDSGGGLTVHTCWGTNTCSGLSENCICTWVPDYGSRMRVVIMDSDLSTNEVVLKKLSSVPGGDSMANEAGMHHAMRIVDKHRGILYSGSDPQRGRIYMLSFPLNLEEVADRVFAPAVLSLN